MIIIYQVTNVIAKYLHCFGTSSIIINININNIITTLMKKDMKKDLKKDMKKDADADADADGPLNTDTKIFALRVLTLHCFGNFSEF